MKNKIHIESPCSVPWNSMTEVNNGRHCKVCNINVVDFTNMSLEDINQYFKNYTEQKTCGKYHVRHTQNPNKWFSLLNKIEFRYNSTRFKKVTLTAISILLFLTGCRNRHLQGDPRNQHHERTDLEKSEPVTNPKK